MQKSKIEYLTHSWNFYTGCNHWKKGVLSVEQLEWLTVLKGEVWRPSDFDRIVELLK